MNTNIMRYIALLLLGILMWSCSAEKACDARQADVLPDIYPDYIDVTIPATIAPLNFDLVDAHASKIDVLFTGADGSAISCQGKHGIDIPAKQWHHMLAASIGASINVQVYAKHPDGWVEYRPFEMHVSPDSIDYGIMYRLVAPGYEVYNKMGIYQRALSCYDESPVFENFQVEGCLNCHSANRCNPDWFQFHMRGKNGGTVIMRDGKIEAYNTRTDSTISACVYPYWHPGGKYIAYSTNSTHQMVHQAINKNVEVFDEASNVGVYDTEANRLLLPPLLNDTTTWATFPAFSADGNKLFFCQARAQEMPDSVLQIRYDLCSIGFNPEDGSFADKIDTLICASQMGKSISFPRPSHDGRHLMYTLSDYGQFSIWHPEADLWMLDLATGESRPMDRANSDNVESYHSWSTNSRWCVFGSRRENGLYTQPYICHIDADGQESKPFLLPQRNPREYYDKQYRSYNIPEFITKPVPLDRIQTEKKLNSPERKNFGL